MSSARMKMILGLGASADWRAVTGTNSTKMKRAMAAFMRDSKRTMPPCNSYQLEDLDCRVLVPFTNTAYFFAPKSLVQVRRGQPRVRSRFKVFEPPFAALTAG